MSGALIMAAAAKARPMTVTIAGGGGGSGAVNSHTYATNTAVIANGAAPFSYSWNITPVLFSTAMWDFTGQGTASVVPHVSNVDVGEHTTATLVCTVTDALGRVVASNTGSYSWTRTG